MPENCHHFGDLSTQCVTILDASIRHHVGDRLPSMKGKYPNGLKAAMDEAEIGPTQLANEVGGTSKQQIARLADGERELTAIWAERLASRLRVSPVKLVFPDLPEPIKVPLISLVAAGKLTVQENVDSKRHVTVTDLPQGNWLALTVDGDSMNLIAPHGSTILVNRADDRLQDDKFYVFSTGEGAATFKRYRGGPTRLQPYSTNPDHETLYPENDLYVIGRVRRVITELK